jgi:hypothetical protein
MLSSLLLRILSLDEFLFYLLISKAVSLDGRLIFYLFISKAVSLDGHLSFSLFRTEEIPLFF